MSALNERGADDIYKAAPSFSFADIGDPTAVIAYLIGQQLIKEECVTPGIVEIYDRKKHIAFVRPSVKLVGTCGECIKRCPVQCTVMRHYAGNYLIDVPILKGDTGWIVGADVDTENVKESKEPEVPNSLQHHKFRFGFFIPDRWGEYELHEEDIKESRLVIQSKDGSQCVSIGMSDIKIRSGKTIIQTDELEVNAQSNIHFNAPDIFCNGKFHNSTGANGAISAISIATVNDGVVTGIYP